VSPISRNAPCPCGSGKKYKLCCLASKSEAESRPVAETAAQTVRSKAFARLVDFGRKPAFAAALKAAFDELWGPGFREWTDDEQAAAFARPEAQAGIVTYCVLDAPASLGATIAEQFLAQQGKHLSRAEFEYLQRLATTRMGLYRVDEVHRDRGLTCTDLWSNDRIEIREKLATRDVAPKYVIAARTFPAADGATELDGALYAFTEPEARKALAVLRAEWKAAHKTDPALAEERFLKRRFPVVINRFWFDNVFFKGSPPSSNRHGVGTAAIRSSITGTELRYFRIADPKVRELANFMHSTAAPTAMHIDRLHGFLCAVTCSPVLVRPSMWLPLIWGDQPPAFDSQTHAEPVVGLLFDFANKIAMTLADGTFAPLLPLSPGPGMENVAQGWCVGFIEGMALKQRSWNRLLKDPSAHMMVVPILTLASPGALVKDPTPNPQATADIVEMLPTAVSMIAEYWHTVAQERNVVRAQRTRAGRGARIDGAAASTSTVHRLKITLDGVRPAVWRRVEIASDAKLPFVSRVLIASMGWNDTHLHAFRCGTIVYGEPDPEFPNGMRNERSVTLAQIAPQVKTRFFFDYDFGDNWEHTVIVEAIDAAGDSNTPRCTAGARACPPDDCGGVYGYRDLVKTLSDPAREEYAAMRQWAGNDFSPERFDLELVNRELERLARRRRVR
jgi:yecA family protein